MRATARFATTTSALLLALSLASCSDDDKGSTPDHSSKGSSEDTQTITLDEYGVSFEAPEGWTEIDPDEALSGSGSNPALDELAERMGMTPEEAAQGLSAASKLMLFSDAEAVGGFLANINVVIVPGDAGMDDEAIKNDFVALGGTVGDIERGSSEVGDTIRVPYQLPVADHTVEGASIFVDIGDEFVNVTVSTTDADETEELADLVEESLASIE